MLVKVLLNNIYWYNQNRLHLSLLIVYFQVCIPPDFIWLTLHQKRETFPKWFPRVIFSNSAEEIHTSCRFLRACVNSRFEHIKLFHYPPPPLQLGPVLWLSSIILLCLFWGLDVMNTFYICVGINAYNDLDLSSFQIISK